MILELVDVRLREVYDVGGQGLSQHLIIHVRHLLGDADHIVLAHIILGVEEFITDVVRVTKRIYLWEEISSKGSIHASLGRVHESLDHMCSFCGVCAELTRHLILEDESELCASLVEEDLLDHRVRFTRVPDGADED